MPQVPYSPVPQAALSTQGLPEVHPNVPAAAFGGDIATAISGMGKEIAGAGDAVFERAVWLQNLNNQAEARQRSADYTIAAGKLHSEYNALEGDNAVKAYPGYSQKLQALRHQYRDSMSNVGSQRMFDSESLGTMSHAIMNGGTHAAGQQKAFIKGSMDADVTSQYEFAMQNPKDDIAFGKATRNIEGTLRQKGQLEGQSPQAIDNSVASAKSKLWAGKFENLAKEAPFQAQTAMYENRDKMTAADFKRTEALVGAQVHAVGSANIARDLLASHTDEEGNLTAPMAELHVKAKDLATKMSPDDPLFQNQVIKALDTEFNQRKYATKQQKWDNNEIVNSAIKNGARSMQEIMSDPAVYAAYKALPARDQLKVPGQIANYVKSLDRETNDRVMTQLLGMKNNDVEGFLNLDPTAEEYKLSQPQIRQIMGEQTRVKKATAQDPRVDRAMGWMRGSMGAQMEAMGVFRRTQQNKTEYDHLTGAVQQALDLWQEDHKKPPTNKEFNEQIAPEILKVHKEPGMFGIYGGPFGTDRTIFRHDTSSKAYTDFVANAKADITAKGGSEPSDEELYKAYTRVQLLKLYPPTRKPPTDGRPGS